MFSIKLKLEIDVVYIFKFEMKLAGAVLDWGALFELPFWGAISV